VCCTRKAGRRSSACSGERLVGSVRRTQFDQIDPEGVATLVARTISRCGNERLLSGLVKGPTGHGKALRARYFFTNFEPIGTQPRNTKSNHVALDCRCVLRTLVFLSAIGPGKPWVRCCSCSTRSWMDVPRALARWNWKFQTSRYGGILDVWGTWCPIGHFRISHRRRLGPVAARRGGHCGLGAARSRHARIGRLGIGGTVEGQGWQRPTFYLGFNRDPTTRLVGSWTPRTRRDLIYFVVCLRLFGTASWFLLLASGWGTDILFLAESYVQCASSFQCK